MTSTNEEEKTRRALAALDTMATIWAVKANVRVGVRAMIGLPDGEDRLVAFVKQAHVEGLYEGRTSLSKNPRGTDAQIFKERELTAVAIDGAMAFGYQNTNPPPPGEWLAKWWTLGRQIGAHEEREQAHHEELMQALAKGGAGVDSSGDDHVKAFQRKHLGEPYRAPLNCIPATPQHDEGAVAQCFYCRRYTLDPKALSDRQPTCECGKKEGWCGSFKKPGPDAKWSGKAPAGVREGGTDERAAFEARFPKPDAVTWIGTEYEVREGWENSYRIDRFIGQWEAWQAACGVTVWPAKAHQVPQEVLPDASDEARDAARYRWLKAENSGPIGIVRYGMEHDEHIPMKEIDAAIDAAMGARGVPGTLGQGEKTGCECANCANGYGRCQNANAITQVAAGVPTPHRTQQEKP